MHDRADGMTRRRLLQALGGGALVAAAGVGDRLAASAPASPFALTDVRLLEGPFRDAQERDARYLLALDPDRLLHNFRVNAGLAPKADVYGGWESEEPWVGIRCQGHTLGHYLSATAMMFAATGDSRFAARVAAIVSDLQACQAARPDGLVCAFPDGAAQLDNSVAGRPFEGVPWYTMHKIFAGLRDAHLHAGSRAALDVLVRLSDWAGRTTRSLTDDRFERMLGREHGGMAEVLGDVYALTGDAAHLDTARRFVHRAVFAPCAAGRDVLDGLHANTQIPKAIGWQRLYGLTGDPSYGAASRFFWRTVVDARSFVTGGHGDQEHFFPRAEFLRRLTSAKTMETCGTHNMLRLTRMLFAERPAAELADYYERALYNGILASQDPESGMMTYFQATRPGYVKLFHTPTDSFWCCTGTGMENHAKYGDSIYFRAGRTLFVNLFIPSALTWREPGVTVTQTTRFPDEAATSLRIAAAKPTRLAVCVRRPSWCRDLAVRVNGRRWTRDASPAGYVPIDREWRSGDVIDVEMPMALRREPLPGAPALGAFVYGPIVLAGRLGTDGLARGADIIRNERTSGEMLNAAVDPPGLAGTASDILPRVRPVPGAPLTFAAPARDGRAVTLGPYFRIAHERYNLYWDLPR